MEGGGFPNNSGFGGVLSDNGMDLDLMDELLYDGCWLETTAGNKCNFLQAGPVTSGPPSDIPQYFSSATSSGHLDMNLPLQLYQGEMTKCLIENPAPVSPKIQELVANQSQESRDVTTSPGQSESFLLESSEASRRLWIAPKAYPGPSSSVRERLELAVGHINNLLKDRHVLIQIWIPIKREGKQVLTTVNQPFSLDRNCESLVHYRGVSSSYLFAADEDSKLSIGLPGRVFLEKLPEWTPDVRFFKKDEYPRIDYARQYEVRGSIAVPIFERGSRSCLGVVEFVTTTQKTHYRPELDTVCKALAALDLGTSHSICAPSVKASHELYQATIPVIEKVLTSLCMTHKLPLAQTWAPCVQLGKDGCRHSIENYRVCVSTVDSARYMANEEMEQFHEACSEHHLFQGQGLVGRAFLTNRPIFASDVTAFRKTEYPLAHHAMMFKLHAAAAIPLRRIHAGSCDLVLEFFLPEDCQDIKRQKEILNSLSIVIQHTCQMLHLVTGQGFEREGMLPVWEMVIASDGTVNSEEKQTSHFSSKELYSEKPSWITHMIEAQKKGKGVAISIESEKEPKEEFSLTAHQENNFHSELVFSECGQLQQISGANFSTGYNQDSTFDELHSPGSRKSGEKRRTKSEKTISLQVLRQYFAGSLKDAAKSIGVCPTTLKRICRQHGISRWPSRKIKKVGHSLRKLQLVIDSVQGAEGAIQIGNFYKSFPELNSPNFSGTDPLSLSKMSNNSSQQTNPSPENGLCDQGTTASKSLSSSGSDSTGSTSCSTEEKQVTTTYASPSGSKEHGKSLKRALSDAELHFPNQEKLFARSQSHKLISGPPSLENAASLPEYNVQNLNHGRGFRVKATFGDEKVRFSLQPNWGFLDLQQEIARRFKICDLRPFHLSYLDDEKEWVLITCDADLEECVDIYQLTQSRTIKLCLYRASKPDRRVSVGNKVPS